MADIDGRLCLRAQAVVDGTAAQGISMSMLFTGCAAVRLVLSSLMFRQVVFPPSIAVNPAPFYVALFPVVIGLLALIDIRYFGRDWLNGWSDGIKRKYERLALRHRSEPFYRTVRSMLLGMVLGMAAAIICLPLQTPTMSFSEMLCDGYVAGCALYFWALAEVYLHTAMPQDPADRRRVFSGMNGGI